MVREEVCRAIDDCKRNEGLNVNQKKIRLQVLTAYQEKLSYDELRNQRIETYREKVNQFYQQANGKIHLDSDLVCSQIILNDYLLNSELGSYLQYIGRRPKADELYMYALNCELENCKSMPEVITATELYYLIGRFLVEEERINDTLIQFLSPIFGEETLSYYRSQGKINQDGILELQQVKKPEDEYIHDRERIIYQMDTMYKDQVLDSITYQCAEEMLHSLFQFYHGYSEVSLPSYELKEDSRKSK